jgi:hypothetical protein
MSSPRLPEEHDGSTPLHRPALPASSRAQDAVPRNGPPSICTPGSAPEVLRYAAGQGVRSKMAIVGMGISPVSRLCLRMTLTSLWHDDARLDRIVLTKWFVGPAPPVPDSPRSRREAARRCPTLGSCPDDAESFR